MKKSFTNLEMAGMLQALRPILPHRDKTGYAAARNTRILTQSLTEYNTFKNQLVIKYGESEIDEETGKDTGLVTLKANSPNLQAFLNELEPFNTMEHEVELMTLKYEEVIGILSGDEILSIDWMLED